jgi:putative ABC transport system permease protein
VTVTVVIGVMMFAATYDSYHNLTASYQQTYERLAFADMTITGGGDDIAEDIRSIAGVAEVSIRHVADLPITIGDTTLSGRMIGMPAGVQPSINRIDVQEGSYLAATTGPEAVAEVHVARTFELAPGDAFVVELASMPEVTIVGVAASAEYIWPAPSTQEVFVDPEQFGVFFVDEDLVATLPPSVSVRETLVMYDDDADVSRVDDAVAAAATAAGATSVLTQAAQPSNATLKLDVDGFGAMAIAFPVLFLTAAGLAMYVLLTRVVFSQRSIIGTLRASGLSSVRIRRHYLGYGLLIGVVGAVVGVVVGVVMGSVMTELYTGLLDIPDTVVLVRPTTVAIGLAFGIAAGAISAWLPARAAYRIEPAEAMRGAAPLLSAGPSAPERLVTSAAATSVRARMMLRGIGRAKRRSVSTVLGVVLALVLILASGGMIDTIVDLIDEQFNDIATEDATVVASTHIDDDFLDEIAAVPGVDRAEPVATLGVSLSRNGNTVATTLQGFETDTAMHGWTNPSGSLPSNGLLASEALGDRLGLEPGNIVAISIPTHEVTISLVLVEFVDESLGTPLYASLAALADALDVAGIDATDVLGLPTVTTVMTRFDPSASRSATIASIEDVPDVLAVQDERTLYDLVQQYLGLFYAFVGIMLIFGGAMAFALMFNTISINTAERATEFATLKANGMSNREIGRMIVGENILLTTIGIIVGVPVGVWVAGRFLALFDNDTFHFSLSISAVTLVAAAAGMLIVALISLVPAVRTVQRLDVGSVVRERST